MLNIFKARYILIGYFPLILNKKSLKYHFTGKLLLHKTHHIKVHGIKIRYTYVLYLISMLGSLGRYLKKAIYEVITYTIRFHL